MTVPSNLALELARLGHQTFGERPWARSSTPGRWAAKEPDKGQG